MIFSRDLHYVHFLNILAGQTSLYANKREKKNTHTLTVPPKGKFPSSSAHRASCIEYRARNMRTSSIGHRVSSAIIMQALFSQHNLKQKINLLFRICRKLSWITQLDLNRLCLYSRWDAVNLRGSAGPIGRSVGVFAAFETFTLFMNVSRFLQTEVLRSS